MTLVRNNFNNINYPEISKTKGSYIFTKKNKILDVTAGTNSHAIVGYQNPVVLNDLRKQLNKYTHVDYKTWNDKNLELLSDLISSNNIQKLKNVYFCGNSGSEACEAAIYLSYQYHYLNGNPQKKIILSRKQSYHGMTLNSLSIGDRPNLDIFKKLLPKNRYKVSMHHYLYNKKKNESLKQYGLRSAKEIEDKIIQLGPENIAAFVGETIMGGLVGDVPPAPNYWKEIRKICNKYKIHLILDECYCGTGTTGRYFCCDWDQITPDIIFFGKTLAAGYGAISALMFSDEIFKILKDKSGRIQHSTTYQGISLSAAAALSVQKIVKNKTFLDSVNQKSEYLMSTLKSELENNERFKDLRGRGLRFSLEHQTKDNNKFSEELFKLLFFKHNIFSSIKFHRTCFTPPLNISYNDIDYLLDKYIRSFNEVSKNKKY